MPDDVVQGLLHRQEEMVTNLGRHGSTWRIVGKIHLAGDSRATKCFDSKVADVFDEIGQGVVAWVHRPDCFIERFDPLSGHVESLLKMGSDFVWCGPIAKRSLHEQLDLRKASAEIVVDIARDAGAFPIQRGLLLQYAELLLQTSERRIASSH